MKNIIVTTSIFAPTKAIRLFDAMPDWTLIVVGDKKTPENYKLENGIYLSPAEQEKYDKPLSDALGWNNVQRRNIGYLLAYDMGAEVVATIDDDNIPYRGWGEKLMLGRSTYVNYYYIDLPAFDPIGATNYPRLWHRGFPLLLVPHRVYQSTKGIIVPQVQADFWDGDPDIDAICRMEHAPHCGFNPRYFPLASNKPSPFDAQNTFMLREVLPHYFLAPGVGRIDDIWASYYAQARGMVPVYGAASVYHDRTKRNLIPEMKAEYVGHENTLELINDLAVDANRYDWYLSSQALRAKELYLRHFPKEMQ